MERGFIRHYLRELNQGATKKQALKRAWDTPAPLWTREYTQTANRFPQQPSESISQVPPSDTPDIRRLK